MMVSELTKRFNECYSLLVLEYHDDPRRFYEELEKCELDESYWQKGD